ncbi:hypothetical protein N9R86_01380 [Alphaproteobacteria bacterium]|nr:hypothetical protein [Alphaproteobacteria bacterium]
MKLVLVTIKIIFLLSYLFAADFEVTLTGKAEYPYFKEYGKDKIFLLYKNEGQFTSNTAMFGSQFAAASIEFIDGKQTQNLFSTWKDSYGNEGYFKSVSSKVKKIKGNILGDRVGSNVASFICIGGEGPFEELAGIVFLGAYLEMEEGHFIWKGKANISDKAFNAINNYIKVKE